MNEIGQNETDHNSSSKTDGNTVNPILKQLSLLNGKINRMSLGELHAALKSFDLDTRGKKDVLKKRLKSYHKKKKLGNVKELNRVQNFYKYLVVIDYEATCDVGQSEKFKQEIIEFPAILINTRTKAIDDEFHSYVKPFINPTLTKFCTSLTGITQNIVDNAPSFTDTLENFNNWLIKWSLTKENFLIVADGPWDMGRFLVTQCEISKLHIPYWGKRWINLRKAYSNFYDTKRICLNDMLLQLGMKFEGQPHSGIDDARNIARIAIQLLEDGAYLRLNERLKEYRGSIMVSNVSWKEFDDKYSRCTAKLPIEEPVINFVDEMDEDSNSDDNSAHSNLYDDISLSNKFKLMQCK